MSWCRDASMCPATYWFFTLYDKHELSDLAKRDRSSIRGALRRLCRAPTRRAAFHTFAPHAARLPPRESEPVRRLQRTSDSDSSSYLNSSLSSARFYQFRRTTRIVVYGPGIRQRTVYGLEVMPAPREASQGISFLHIVATLPHSPGDARGRNPVFNEVSHVRTDHIEQPGTPRDLVPKPSLATSAHPSEMLRESST